MSWEAVGALAESLGALAVVISLVYLAYQIRQNTHAMRLAEYDSRATAFREIVTNIGRSAESARIFLEGGRDLDALSDVDNVQFVTMMNSAFTTFENFHYKTQQGMVDEQMSESWRNGLHAYLAMPGVHRYWEYQRTMYTKRFQAYVDREIADIASGNMEPGYSATQLHQTNRGHS